MSNLRGTKRCVPRISLVSLLLLGCALGAFGHGASSELVRGCIGVRATYDDGSPMAYCDVEVLAPAESDAPYQQGSTDSDGRFAFVPVEVGSWTIVIDDGMGHQTAIDVAVDSLGIVGKRRHSKTDRLSTGIVGVSIIFGLFGLYALIRSRRSV